MVNWRKRFENCQSYKYYFYWIRLCKGIRWWTRTAQNPKRKHNLLEIRFLPSAFIIYFPVFWGYLLVDRISIFVGCSEALHSLNIISFIQRWTCGDYDSRLCFRYNILGRSEIFRRWTRGTMFLVRHKAKCDGMDPEGFQCSVHGPRVRRWELPSPRRDCILFQWQRPMHLLADESGESTGNSDSARPETKIRRWNFCSCMCRFP